MGKIVSMETARSMKNAPSVIVSVEEITPEIAGQWLQANRLNRPVRASHTAFLAREMEEGLWQLNGQPIVICSTEDVLDGQHRLLAVIEAGVTIRSLVVYGIDREAFKTMDTGAVRTSSDALAVWFTEHRVSEVRAVAAAIPYCAALEQNAIRLHGKLANAEAIAYAAAHPSMWECAKALLSYPKDARIMSLGCGTALYEMFQRKDQELAAEFMQQIYTGENMVRNTPTYVLRGLFEADQRRSTSSYPAALKMRMSIKAWNLARRGHDHVNRQAIVIHPNDADQPIIL